MRLRDLATLAHLIATQWAPPAYIKWVQSQRLSRLVTHAYERVPFYRQLYDAHGVKPEDIRSAEDLRRLPVISKADLIGLSPQAVTARGTNLGQCRTHCTSGTTGAPLQVYFRRDDWTRMNLGNVRAFAACGARPWHRVVAFVGRTEITKKPSWYEYLGLWRQRDLSSWSEPGSWIESLRRWQPQTIVGCVITLRVLAEAIEQSGVTDIRPQVIISGSNALDDFTRSLFERVFRCIVADFYGATETGALAWECKRCRAYHIGADHVVLEVLRNGVPVEPGEDGEVVITNLQYRAMPFIRYRLGDVAALSTRSPICGRGLPLLDHIGGRRDEWVSLPSGRRIPAQPFFYAIQTVPGVRRWKVVQESLTSLRVDIEPDGTFGSDSRELIERNLQRLLGGEIQPEITLTPAIKIDPVTKIRQVSSLILPKERGW